MKTRMCYEKEIVVPETEMDGSVLQHIAYYKMWEVIEMRRQWNSQCKEVAPQWGCGRWSVTPPDGEGLMRLTTKWVHLAGKETQVSIQVAVVNEPGIMNLGKTQMNALALHQNNWMEYEESIRQCQLFNLDSIVDLRPLKSSAKSESE